MRRYFCEKSWGPCAPSKSPSSSATTYIQWTRVCIAYMRGQGWKMRGKRLMSYSPILWSAQGLCWSEAEWRDSGPIHILLASLWVFFQPIKLQQLERDIVLQHRWIQLKHIIPACSKAHWDAIHPWFNTMSTFLPKIMHLHAMSWAPVDKNSYKSTCIVPSLDEHPINCPTSTTESLSDENKETAK